MSFPENQMARNALSQSNVLAQLPGDFKAAILKKGDAPMEEATLYHKFPLEVGANAYRDMLKSDDAEKVGITTFSRKKIKSNMIFITDGLKIAISKSVLLNDKASTKIANLPLSAKRSTEVGSQTAGLESAELVIKSGGSEILRKPIGDFLRESDSTPSGDPRECIYDLKTALVFFPDKEVEIDIDFGEASLEGNAASFRVVGVFFYGHKTIQR